MENFRYHVDTEILFGKGQVENLPNVLKRFGKRVLLTYGGGSIKKIGLYDKVKRLLKDFEVYELGGIEPNPRLESVNTGRELCREKGIDVILAVGGGSTIDCSKAIAAATFYKGDPWDLVINPSKITKALPICTILTLSATGSEMDGGAVITNLKTKEKKGLMNELVRPKVSILDPENTFTVSAIQTAAGAADILSHLFEFYFNKKGAFISNGISEVLMKAVFKYAPIALREPDNYEARAQLMWASSLALNGICIIGRPFVAASCHAMEHELSAYYDITHGIGLAILTPKWMRYVLNSSTVNMFAEYAVNVWNIDASLDKYKVANMGIDLTEKFLRNLEIPMTLSELNIGEEHFEEMAEHAVQLANLSNAVVPLNKDDVVNIYKMCL